MEEMIVSVIVPAYNCAPFIAQALDSALIQDVPLEIIVINDCSTDGLDSIMARYQTCPQIRYIKNETNLGVAETRNRGVRLAQGKYIAFLDADDYWEAGKLKKQIRLLEEKNAVICSTARELMNPDGTLTGYIIPVKTEFTFRDLRLQNQINCSSVLIKTEVAREFPMQHDDSHEDYLMWLRILEKYKKGYAINEPLLKYRITNTGKSGNKWHSAKMTYRTYRYMGYGFFRTALYFTVYALHGAKKYFRWFLK
ncbi:MAG: glycosyltransferase family 2 protein [Oscillospiraceae bacterium]|nr:glycosyltransferase family 2 protein [Oscillospiraceae bacterium]